MLVSDQDCENVQLAGAVFAGTQVTNPAGTAAGAGAKESTGVGKLPVPVTVKAPATETCCVAKDLVTVSSYAAVAVPVIAGRLSTMLLAWLLNRLLTDHVYADLTVVPA